MSTATEPIAIPHPAATLNRQAKAVRVVQFLESRPDLYGGYLTASAVADFPAPLWASINELMEEERPMSPLTISMVIGMLTIRDIT